MRGKDAARKIQGDRKVRAGIYPKMLGRRSRHLAEVDRQISEDEAFEREVARVQAAQRARLGT